MQIIFFSRLAYDILGFFDYLRFFFNFFLNLIQIGHIWVAQFFQGKFVAIDFLMCRFFENVVRFTTGTNLEMDIFFYFFFQKFFEKHQTDIIFYLSISNFTRFIQNFRLISGEFFFVNFRIKIRTFFQFVIIFIIFLNFALKQLRFRAFF